MPDRTGYPDTLKLTAEVPAGGGSAVKTAVAPCPTGQSWSLQRCRITTTLVAPAVNVFAYVLVSIAPEASQFSGVLFTPADQLAGQWIDYAAAPPADTDRVPRNWPGADPLTPVSHHTDQQLGPDECPAGSAVRLDLFVMGAPLVPRTLVACSIPRWVWTG